MEGKMRNFFSMVTVVLMMFCYFSIQAVDLRIVLLPKMTVDGKEYDSASIETEMASILTGKNMRIVELSTALKAQKAALQISLRKERFRPNFRYLTLMHWFQPSLPVIKTQIQSWEAT